MGFITFTDIYIFNDEKFSSVFNLVIDFIM